MDRWRRFSGSAARSRSADETVRPARTENVRPAVAALAGAESELGLGAALGRHMEGLNCPHADSSLVLAAYRAGIPCTIHVALGTDVVHVHPHVSGAALGEASLLDFRHLCTVVATL